MSLIGTPLVKRAVNKSVCVVIEQAKSHLCAAKCCDNLVASKEEVQQCMNQCFIPIQQIQEYIGKELTGFQVCNKAETEYIVLLLQHFK